MSPNELHNSNTMSDERITPYPLRIPPEMRDKLESAAKAGNRSLHAEIIMRLEFTINNPSYLGQSRATGSFRDDLIDIRKLLAPQLHKIAEELNTRERERQLNFLLEIKKQLSPLTELRDKVKSVRTPEEWEILQAELDAADDNESLDTVIERADEKMDKKRNSTQKPPKK